MQVNLPVWGYYPKEGTFIDPLYVPYKNSEEETFPNEYSGECDSVQKCPVNRWEKQGYRDGFVNEALVRKGWGLDFQLLHPDKDPCPEGWTKGKDGWCSANVAEFGDNGLYSDRAFVPKYQYWDSYAPRTLVDSSKKYINQFDMRSVDPWTGDYKMYINSKPSYNRQIYGLNPAKDSYLA